MNDRRKYFVTAVSGNKVIDEMEFEGPADLEIFIDIVVPPLPERSPLHPEALNLDDIEVGLNVQQHNIHGRNIHRVGIVNGEVFLRGDKYQEPWDTQDDDLMVPVVTTNYGGRLVHEDWILADMGVVPYVGGDNGPFWNDQNYTLAVR